MEFPAISKLLTERDTLSEQLKDAQFDARTLRAQLEEARTELADEESDHKETAAIGAAEIQRLGAQLEEAVVLLRRAFGYEHAWQGATYACSSTLYDARAFLSRLDAAKETR